MRPIRSILVAVDFSESSEQALTAAIDLARQTGAELHVAHALDLPIALFNPYAVSLPDALVTQARDEAARRLRETVERVAKEGVTAKSRLSEVPAAPAIARLAEEIGADLIVMGTHGHTGLKHVLLGSVAERTLRLAPCSVLIVKEKGSRAS